MSTHKQERTNGGRGLASRLPLEVKMFLYCCKYGKSSKFRPFAVPRHPRHHLRNVMHVGDETDYCWQCACIASFRFVARERIGTLMVNRDIYRLTSLSLLLQLYRSLCYLLRQYVVDTCVDRFYAKKPRSLFTEALRLKPSVQDRTNRSELDSLE